MKPLTLLLLLAQCAFSQTDTLVIGKYKFSLQRVKMHYDSWQPGVARLPMEYAEHKPDVEIKDMMLTDSLYAYEVDDGGVSYLVTKAYAPQIKKPESIHLHGFLDTVRVSFNELINLKGYLTQHGRRYPLTSLSMLHLDRGSSTEFLVPHVNTNVFALFDFFNDADYRQRWQHTFFAITAMYYQKGQATYYLNRSLIFYID